MRAFLSAFLLCLGVVFVHSETFDKYIQECMDTWSAPGVAIGILKDGKIVLAKGYGVKRLGSLDLVDEETIFPIASLTKAFTATLAGMLVDEGKLGWDDPIIEHLPQFQLYDPYMTREITVRDLLCNRSGLERAEFLWYASSYDKNEVMHRMRFLPPKWGFRSRFTYSNILYSTVGLLEEAVTGKSWKELVQERIFNPLGMKLSTVAIQEVPEYANVTSAHTMYQGQMTPIRFLEFDNCLPAAGICSNVVDLLKWLSLQMQDGLFEQAQLVQKKTMHEMHAPQTLLNDPDWESLLPGSFFPTYGLGWLVHEYQGRVIIEHLGCLQGVTALIAMVPEESLGFIILVNRDSGCLFPKAIQNQILDSYFGHSEINWNKHFFDLYLQYKEAGYKKEEEEQSQRVTDSIPSLPLDNYIGTYESALYGEVHVRESNGSLELYSRTFNGHMTHWHFDTFTLSPRLELSLIRERLFVTFMLDRHGKVDALKINTTSPEDVVFHKLKAN